jgi:ADP-heptose:LPS heptosyltransferase
MLSDYRHILVVHVAGLAQTTLALPAFRSLRKHFPRARITAVSSATAADLLRLAGGAASAFGAASGERGCVDEVLPVARVQGVEFLNPRKIYRASKSLAELRREYFDLAIEFKINTESGVVLQFARPRERMGGKTSFNQGIEAAMDRLSEALSRRPAALRHVAHEYLRRLEPLGVRPVEAEPRITTLREADERIEKLLSKHNIEFGQLLVGVHPGAGPGKPRWPIDRFVSIASRMIHNFDARVLLFAGPNERGSAKRMAAMLPARRAVVLESPKMADFASATARLSLFIANQSGPAHVAAAAGAPVVVASTSVQPSAMDLLGTRVEHVRAPHPSLISEEEIYEAACRLLKTNRAEFLRSR